MVSTDRATELAAATAVVVERDPVLAPLVESAGPCHLSWQVGQLTHFGALARSVVYQQLAGAAARAIFGRTLRAATGGDDPLLLCPEAVLATAQEDLRAAGLSANKARTLRSLAELAASGALGLEEVESATDEEIVANLSAAPGIGRWTAEMFLIFQLGRLDVWPVGDLGVRKGYAAAWGLAELPKPKELEKYGDPFRPYRTIVAWYCWRAAEALARPVRQG